MPTPLIAYPFRLSPAGSVATVDQSSDAQLSQEVAVAILTKTGERVLVPEFGLDDPVFSGFDADALRLHIDLFGPPVRIQDVRSEFLNEASQDVIVEFVSEG